MTNTDANIICPACGSEMIKISSNGVTVDVCANSCGGIYFDNRELEKFDEKHEDASAIFNSLKDKTFKEVDDTKTRICPFCEIPMTKMGSGVANVKIDVCNICGGKFLDNGELEKIRQGKAVSTSKVDTLLQIVYDELPEIGNSPRRQFFEDIVRKYL